MISGGTKGVGRAAAEEFARQGAKVVIGGRDEESAMKSIRLMRTYGTEGLFVYTDLENVEDCKKLMDETYNRFGKIDGFFNYAGITPVSPLDTCDEYTFDKVMDVNFKACFFCCQQAIKYMRMNGGGRLSSRVQLMLGEGKKIVVHMLVQRSLRILMEHLSHQYAKEHIRCNYLTLGWTPTEGEVALRISQGESEAHLRERAGAYLPMGRMCEKTDYLDGLVYMMSDGSSMMTGSTFRITAGEYIG